MLKLTEKYATKPAQELPMLFQRILQNNSRPFPAPEGALDVDDAAFRIRAQG